VKVTLVPSSVSERSQPEPQFLTSLLINDTLAVDAGCLGLYATAEEQAKIKHVLISHTHIDHIGSLPIFVENVYEARRECVTIHGSAAVLDCLRTDVFNDRVWPDLIRLSTKDAPFLKLATLEPRKMIELENLRITPIPVNHVVPTLGFIIEDADAAVVVVSDTGPTDEIWKYASATPKLKAVFLEATFPNSMIELAKVSKHLTPALFAGEIQKLKKRAAVIALHIKARHWNQVVSELQALGIPGLEIGQFARPYSF
jgi:cAMP phosphodiesterase